MVDAEKIVDSSASSAFSSKNMEAVQGVGNFAVSPFDDAARQTYAHFCRTALHSTPQNPSFVAAWAANPETDIVIATVCDSGQLALMLPLEIVRDGAFKIARHPGGRHANGSFPAMVNAAFAGDLTDQQHRLVAALKKTRPDIDMLSLERNERKRGGCSNPLRGPGATQSPNVALAVDLNGGFEALLERSSGKRKRKKHRSQSRKFEAAGGHRHYAAETPEDVDALLSAFFAMKASRFRQMGIADVFADDAVKHAFRRMFAGALAKDSADFVLHGLEIGGILRAVTGSSISGDRITCEFSAFRDDELSSASPGDFLFFENIREACESGMAIYDFGVGDEKYKRLWCDIESRHFDLFLPLTAKGWLLAASRRAIGAAKRGIKENPLVWSMVKRLRRAKAAETASGSEG